MSTYPRNSELDALKQQALAGDIDQMRTSYERGELQWLRNHMTPERYAHLGDSLKRSDLESVRGDLASVVIPADVVTAPIADGDATRRSLLVQSQRNGLIAVAIIAALAVLVVLGLLALRNNDKSADTTTALATGTASETIPDTIGSNTIAPSETTVAPTSPETLAASTILVAPVAATQPARATVQSTAKAAVQTTAPAVAAPAASAVAPVTAAGAAKSDVLTTAERSSTFGPFLAMINAAGLREEIQTLNPSTVFAPTESAFSSLPVEVQAALKSPANKATLARIVRYNVIPQAITLRQFTSSELKSLEGNTLSVVVGNNKVVINDAMVTGGDVLTTTGVMHAIDKLLTPPGVSLNALAAKPAPSATAPPQTVAPTTQALATIPSATQPIATIPPTPTTQAPTSTTTNSVTTTKVA